MKVWFSGFALEYIVEYRPFRAEICTGTGRAHFFVIENERAAGPRRRVMVKAARSSSHSNSAGQAYTEYVVILAVLFALGFGVASVFIGFDQIREVFFEYYASLANFLNLPCF